MPPRAGRALPENDDLRAPRVALEGGGAEHAGVENGGRKVSGRERRGTHAARAAEPRQAA